MHNTKIYFTKEGFTKLETDLAALRAKREPTVLRLQAAREMGDLSENGAYKAARFELSDIDRNIRRLTGLLKNAEVRPAKHDGTIGFGNVVYLTKDDLKISFTLVSKFESDPLLSRLSTESPLGEALIGKRVGETVTVNAPAGLMTYQIVKIE